MLCKILLIVALTAAGALPADAFALGRGGAYGGARWNGGFHGSPIGRPFAVRRRAPLFPYANRFPRFAFRRAHYYPAYPYGYSGGNPIIQNIYENPPPPPQPPQIVTSGAKSVTPPASSPGAPPPAAEEGKQQQTFTCARKQTINLGKGLGVQESDLGCISP